jgi:EAL domain-containing protein (putative c-di-GMP-specific phosphodiesterase class I)
LEFLIEHGCSVAQGFLFGRPIHRNEIQPLLEDLRDEAQGGSTARVPAIRA